MISRKVRLVETEETLSELVRVRMGDVCSAGLWLDLFSVCTIKKTTLVEMERSSLYECACFERAVQ